MPETPISAVFFDAAGTLFRLRESVGQGYSSVARRFAFSLDPAATEEEFRRQWRATPPESTGTPPADGGKAWWRGLVERLLTSLDPAGRISAETREAYFEALYSHYAEPAQWILFRETERILETLRNDRPDLSLIVLSNFDGRLHRILEGLGLRPYFEDVVISSEIGYSKPDPGIFEEARLRHGLLPENCLHVGDDPEEDWAGARRAGLKVLELKRPEVNLGRLLPLLPT